MRLVIAEIGKFELYAWALCFVLQVGLMGLLIFRRHYMTLPAFTAYLTGSLAQNVAQFFIYRRVGLQSASAWAWGLQFAVTALRLAAVLEICWLVFGNYRGIWVFIWRTLVICVVLVAVLSMILSERGLRYGILYADRGAGLSLATAIVGLLIFARYYQVEPEDALRSLAIGFFLYACFVVVNDTLLETSKPVYGALWNFLGTVSFTSSVLVWGWALRRTVELPSTAEEMLPASVYREMSPAVNERLSALNDRLGHLFKEHKP
jgi:hypothetical protein